MAGEPNDDEREGGGTEGYVRGRAGAGNAGFETRDVEEGGVVSVVFALTYDAGKGEVVGGENGKGEEDAEEADVEGGVVVSEVVGRWIEEGGRGIGTPGTGREDEGAPFGTRRMEVEGDEVLDCERRCVGCEYGSCDARPMRLSTGSPSCSRDQD